MKANTLTPDQYCQERAAKSGSSFYYSFLFLPPPKRRAITALYAFCREVDDVADECHDAAIARTKLAWWRNEICQHLRRPPRAPRGPGPGAAGSGIRPARRRVR